MANIDDRNKLIAKNTLMLYGRTFITMIISFWTSRLILDALGIDNYGIKNVVGSIVAFSSLLTGAMSSAGSRYITYALGKGDLNELKGVFRASFQVQLLLGILLFILLESVGVFFLNYKANIPEGRMFAANIVLQLSIITLLIELLSVPYNSLIIAHEKMSLYAYMSIADVCYILLCAIGVLYLPGDKLILMSILQLVGYILITAFYAIYSRLNFREARISFKFNWDKIKEIASFSGWNYIGNATWIFNTQGLNMLVNGFFGVAFNAARGISGTVNGCIQGFVNNFSVAFTPQITKSYAGNETSYCYDLVNRGTRITLLLQTLFMVPVFLEVDTILKVWLVEVPIMADIFVQLSLIESFILSLSGSLLKLIQAHGKIRRIVLETSIFSCLLFPLTWVSYKMGMPVWVSSPIFILIYLVITGIYLYELTRLTTYNWRSYFTSVISPCILTLAISFIPFIIICEYWEDSVMRFFIVVPLSLSWTGIIIFLCGLTKGERLFILEKIDSYKLKFLRTV